MALTLPLARFDTVVYKNKSATDAAQVPAQGTFTPFRDVLGKIPLTAPYVSDATTGRFGCYLDSARFDYRVAITGAGSRLHVDQFGGPETTFLPYLSARNFASLDDAILSCPDGQETTIVLEPITYDRTATLVIPATKRVRLLGAGRDLTVIRCDDPLVDIVRVEGSHSTLESLSVKGPGAAVLGLQPEEAGRGVVVGRVGEGAQPVQDFAMRGCRVHETASWAVWFVGWDDAGGVPQASLCLLSRLERCELSDNEAHGLLRVRRGCTTLTFSGCALLRNKGYGARIENCEQVTVLETVFEDGDDTQPYVELANAFSCAMTQCWFEHRGGWGEQHDSNTQRFVRILNFCRSTTLLGCHFVRNAGSAVPPVGDARLIEIGMETGAVAARARNTVILGCDAVVPGEPAGDDHVLIHAGSDSTIGVTRLQASVSGNPVYRFASVSEPQGDAAAGNWTTLIGPGACVRFPRFRPNDPANVELTGWTPSPGDVRFDASTHRLMLYTDAGWRSLSVDP